MVSIIHIKGVLLKGPCSAFKKRLSFDTRQYSNIALLPHPIYCIKRLAAVFIRKNSVRSVQSPHFT